MTGRNRHNKYRSSIYRRRSIGLIALVSVLSLVTILTVFLIVGTLLHKQSESRNPSDNTDDAITEATTTQTEKTPLEVIEAYSVDIVTDDDTYFSDRLDSLVEKEVSAASIPLNTPDGALLFRSDIADSIAFPTGTAKVSLSSLTDAAGERGVYLSGVFYVNTFKIEDSLLRSVELSKNAAIIAEVLNAGFNDVVIIAPHITEAHIDEVIRFTENIRSLTDKGVIGLALTDAILDIEDTVKVSQIIADLDAKIDFLALNTVDCATTEEISEKINTCKLYLHMYKMRLLLPHVSNTDKQNEIIACATNNGIKNWQTAK